MRLRAAQLRQPGPAPAAGEGSGPIDGTGDTGGGDPELATACELFAEVVGAGPVGPDDDLFAAAGDSLMAMNLMAIARKRFDAGGASLPDFLAEPTPRGLLAVLRAAEPPPVEAADRSVPHPGQPGVDQEAALRACSSGPPGRPSQGGG